MPLLLLACLNAATPWTWSLDTETETLVGAVSEAQLGGSAAALELHLYPDVAEAEDGAPTAQTWWEVRVFVRQGERLVGVSDGVALPSLHALLLGGHAQALLSQVNALAA